MPKTYFLTGGTGFLGSFLSAELLKKGNRIIFLGRSKDGVSFEKRIHQNLKNIDSSISLNNVKTIETDFQKNDLGIKETDWVNEKIDGFWHLAASLSFREKDRKETFSTNVGSLKNILQFVSRINRPIYYVSTAYVHGKRPGEIFERDLVRPKRGFNNPYEESKFEAEKIIREWGKQKENRFITFRTSILVEEGERKTINFFGYYAVVHSLYKLKKKLGNKKIFFPFPFHKSSSLNLMPVSIAIDWMIEISQNPKALGKTFHITNPTPFSIKEMAEQTFKIFGFKILTFKTPRWFTRLYFSLFCLLGSLIKPLRGIAGKFYYFKYYIVEDNTYDMANTEKFVGEEKIRQIKFPSDFVKTIAENFVKKLNSG